jgi:hypothetical protein
MCSPLWGIIRIMGSSILLHQAAVQRVAMIGEAALVQHKAGGCLLCGSMGLNSENIKVHFS